MSKTATSITHNVLLQFIISEFNIHFHMSLPSPHLYQNDQRKDLSSSLICHVKDVSSEILLNKEIKKEDSIKNYKLTCELVLGVNSITIADNSLPPFNGRNSTTQQVSDDTISSSIDSQCFQNKNID